MTHRPLALIALLAFALLGAGAGKPSPEPEAEMPASVYAIPLETIEGSATSLEPFRGQVLLIVNVASKCGFTPQYEGLQALHERFHGQGLQVLGFPANDFMGQEPGSNAEILEFCNAKYGVSFPLFAKLHVKGEAQHPLFRYLTAGAGDSTLAGEVGWNFNKFLVDREGRLIARFGSRTGPLDEELIAAVEKALAG
jgi:glutathione peroxidase